MAYSIEEIEGIGPAYGTKLREVGITTTEDLLELCCDAAGRKKIAEAAGFETSTILEWVNLADLMRIKGVGEEYADLLEEAGVDTVKELATRNAEENLTEKMEEVNVEKKLVRSTPSLSQVEKWIEEAKGLDPIVTH